jgi:hypothetical protein
MSKGLPFQARYFPFSKIHPHLIFMCECRIKKSSLLLKINHAFGSETCVYSWYTSPHGSKQLLSDFRIPFMTLLTAFSKSAEIIHFFIGEVKRDY